MNIVQAAIVKVAPEGAIAVAAKGKRVAKQHPLHRNDAHDDAGLGERVNDVLVAAQRPVEERQAQGHHKHQGRAGKDPGDTRSVP